MQIETLDENTALQRVTMVYPHIMIETPSDAVALIVPSLEPGDLPLFLVNDGVTFKVGAIDKSALTINKLLRVSSLTYHKNATENVSLKSVQDIMNARIV